MTSLETEPAPLFVKDDSQRKDFSGWGATSALVVVATLAVAVRLRMLLVGRSLWLDEAMLALNICGRSFGDLAKPLDDDQAAPLGFLFVERVAVLAFGPSEWALRLVPFLAGLASLILVYRLVVMVGWGRWAGVVGLSLAATSPSLIYYSAELKQYSSDIAISLGMMVLAIPVLRDGWTLVRAVVLALVGALAVWFSHPSIFVLAGIGTTLFLQSVLDRRPRMALVTVLVAGGWLASFAVEYFGFLRDLQANSWLADFWESGFLKFPPRSAKDLKGYPAVGLGLFEALALNTQVDVDLGARMGVFLAAVWLIGALVAIQSGRGRWLALVASPLAFAVLASILGKYPLKGRLALFTAGATLPVIAVGIAGLGASRDALNRGIAAVLLLGALLLPTMQATQLLVERPRLHDARGVLSAMVHDWRPGDLVVVDRYSSPPFRYYKQYGKVGLDAIDPTTSARSLCEPADLAAELRQRRGQGRVWFVLDADLPDPSNFSKIGLRVQLDEAGTRLASFTSRRYSAHLYQLDRPLGTH